MSKKGKKLDISQARELFGADESSELPSAPMRSYEEAGPRGGYGDEPRGYRGPRGFGDREERTPALEDMPSRADSSSNWRSNRLEQPRDRPPRRFEDGDRPPRRFEDGDRPPRRFEDGDRPPRRFEDGERPPRRFEDGERPPRRFEERPPRRFEDRESSEPADDQPWSRGAPRPAGGDRGGYGSRGGFGGGYRDREGPRPAFGGDREPRGYGDRERSYGGDRGYGGDRDRGYGGDRGFGGGYGGRRFDREDRDGFRTVRDEGRRPYGRDRDDYGERPRLNLLKPGQSRPAAPGLSADPTPAEMAAAQKAQEEAKLKAQATEKSSKPKKNPFGSAKPVMTADPILGVKPPVMEKKSAVTHDKPKKEGESPRSPKKSPKKSPRKSPKKSPRKPEPDTESTPVDAVTSKMAKATIEDPMEECIAKLNKAIAEDYEDSETCTIVREGLAKASSAAETRSFISALGVAIFNKVFDFWVDRDALFDFYKSVIQVASDKGADAQYYLLRAAQSAWVEHNKQPAEAIHYLFSTLYKLKLCRPAAYLEFSQSREKAEGRRETLFKVMRLIEDIEEDAEAERRKQEEEDAEGEEEDELDDQLSKEFGANPNYDSAR